MATNYLGMLGQGFNYAQIRDSFGDARDNLQEGFGAIIFLVSRICYTGQMGAGNLHCLGRFVGV